MDDLKELRRWLGYSAVNLFGVSYDDLRENEAEWWDPISISYRGHGIVTASSRIMPEGTDSWLNNSLAYSGRGTCTRSRDCATLG